MGNIFQRCKDDADDTGRGASRDEPPPAKAPLPEEEAKAPPSHGHDHGHGHGHDHGGGEHAQVISLGTATLGGGTLMADREGECAAGGATTFGVEALDGAAPPTEAWVESGHHERLCEPVRAEDHAGTHWHFTITPGGDEVPRYLVVCSDEDHIARFALFPGAAPARGGILAPLYVAGGDQAPVPPRPPTARPVSQTFAKARRPPRLNDLPRSPHARHTSHSHLVLLS